MAISKGREAAKIFTREVKLKKEVSNLINLDGLILSFIYTSYITKDQPISSSSMAAKARSTAESAICFGTN